MSMTKIRMATSEDFPWIERLAVDSIVYGIPQGRDIPLADVRRNALQALQDLPSVLELPERMAVLVAEYKERPVGYMILEFNHTESSTGERQCYIMDVALEPEAWGSEVSRIMMNHAARLTAERGYKYMTAMITADNRRALLIAQRLGFEIERHSLVLAVGPEGPRKMPGRPPGEKPPRRPRGS